MDVENCIQNACIWPKRNESIISNVNRGQKSWFPLGKYFIFAIAVAWFNRLIRSEKKIRSLCCCCKGSHRDETRLMKIAALQLEDCKVSYLDS